MRVSPIFNGAQLEWAQWSNQSAQVIIIIIPTGRQPFAALDPLNGTGVISWQDTRNIPGNTGDNIFMCHFR